MCGIAAIYNYHYAAPEADREELGRIVNHMTSRGPDGKGEWYSPDGRIGMGHRRLSIIDLSDRAAQPMCTPDGRFVISYNGEIYNYKALRRTLEHNGYVFQSRSDTEVLLHLYEEKGEAMLHDLRGMFAFALWDTRENILFLARDPYGIKPLYYADDGWTLRVASQVKALIAGGKVSHQTDPAGMVGFYLFGSVPEPYTTYQGIRAVPAGSFIWVNELGPSEPRCYASIAETFRNAAFNPRNFDKKSLQEIVRESLLNSVKHHLVADVPVGVFLSAGVDSGTLVGLMKDAGQEDIQSVTLAFEEFHRQAEDEAPLAEQVAKLYHTHHTTRMVTKTEFQKEIPKILDSMDQPSIDGVNTWFVSKAALELGLKVAISGLGGDELFGGYPSFKNIPRWVRAFAVPSNIPFMGDLTRIALSFLLKNNTAYSTKICGAVKYGGTYPGAYLLQRGIFMPWELPVIMDKETAIEGLRRLAPLSHIKNAIQPDPKVPFARVATLESCLYMRNQLLRDADWAGMAHSIEIRTPLVDANVLYSLSPVLTSQTKIKGKVLLAHCPEKPLDARVTDRNKTGFSIPINIWMDALGKCLDTWRRVPLLARNGCHWSRRLAYALQSQTLS